MHIVVTGASGFVGRALIVTLAAEGHTGVAVSRRPIESLPDRWAHGDREALVAGTPAVRPDAVVHLEARHHEYVADADSEQAAAFTATNVGNAREWLSWAAARRVDRFVFFSSIKAIDAARAAAANGTIDESASGPGPTLYGRTKWQAEQDVRAWAATPGRRALILRPAVIYGPGNTANIYSMIAGIARNRFAFVGANANVKSLVSLRNAVAATAYLLARMRDGCEIYHLVDAQRYTVRELAGLTARALGVPAPARTIPVAAARAIAAAADLVSRATGRPLPIGRGRIDAMCEHADFTAGKLMAAGFVHPQSTEQGLAEMAAWYRGRTGRAS